MVASEIRGLLGRWDVLLLQEERHEDRDLPWPVADSGTALRPPADVAAVAELEERLGMRLPPSYREFLLASDGAWGQPGWGLCGRREAPAEGDSSRDVLKWSLGLFDVGHVGWLRDIDPSLLDIWVFEQLPGGGVDEHPAFTAPEPERHYLDTDRCRESTKDGHLLYALQISGNRDGYVIFLNPLVVDGAGEWEAWDFGVKSLGATRYRSFADLLAADIQLLQRRAQRPRTGRTAQEWEAVVRDCAADPAVRSEAVSTLAYLGAAESVRDVLMEWALDTSPAGLFQRSLALRTLGSLGGPEVTPLLISAAQDRDARLRAAALPALAASHDPAARQTAVSVLINPDEEDGVVRSVGRSGAEALLDAWHLGRQGRVLAWVAYHRDKRAVPALIEAIPDPALPAADRSALVQYADWPDEPAVIPALLAAVELPGGVWETIARALLRLGAVEAAADVLARLLHRAAAEGPGLHNYAPLGHAIHAAATLNQPSTTSALVDLCRRHPTARGLRALGWTAGEPSLAVLVEAAGDPDLHLAAIDALERMAGPAAAAVLADRAAGGDTLALRALARRRDPRARQLLLDLLDGGDPRSVRSGAEGLRDLKDASTADAVLAALAVAQDADLRAVLAHALVSMGTAQAGGVAIARLRRDSDADLNRLAEVWDRQGRNLGDDHE